MNFSTYELVRFPTYERVSFFRLMGFSLLQPMSLRPFSAYELAHRLKGPARDPPNNNYRHDDHPPDERTVTATFGA